MVEAELWRAVGAELARRRERKGYSSADDFRKRNHGSPATNTLMVIEKGRPGRIANIDSYCRALGTTTADVLRTVLDAADGLGPTLSDEEWKLVQTFRDIPVSPGRDAWLVLAEALAAEHDDVDPDD